METGQTTQQRISGPPRRKAVRLRLGAVTLLLLLAAGTAAYLAPGFAEVAWGEGTVLVIGRERVGENLVLVKEREILLNVATLQEHLDPHIYWDEAERTAVVTTADRVIHMRSDTLTAEVNLQPVELHFPLREEVDSLYLPLLFLADFYELTVRHHPESDTVVIDRAGEDEYLAAVTAGSVRLREGPGLRYPYLTRLKLNDQVRLAPDEPGDWLLVRTANGITGYLPRSAVAISGPAPGPEPRPSDPAASPGLPPPPLVMVWEFTYPNPDVNTIGLMPSLQIVSPTWFNLKDSQGNLANRADPAYVHWARERGYQIWALVASDFYNPDNTAAVLSSSATRRKVIDQLLIYAHLYSLDGINLDFENFHYSYGALYTQFVRELAPLCREAGLVLSVDVSMITKSDYWGRGYQHGPLAEAADYLMLMAYDEHWASSPVAGSVASLPWVERGLRQVLEVVPAEKLFLGVPFYTYLWQLEPLEGGAEDVTSRAFSMDRIEEILSEHEHIVEWDNAAGQHRATYTDGGRSFKVWLEDPLSMRQRLELVNRYQLAGVAGWRRGFEKSEIWELIEEVLSDYGQSN
jgi:spore germination protein YaaH